MASPLHNYLRMYRKRIGFSQAEMAFLLGTKSAAKISRYEHGHRQPSLRTLLAYEAVFGVPSRNFFAGAFRGTNHMIRKRAASLLKKLSSQARHNPRTLRKIEILRAITKPNSDNQ